MSFLGAPLCTLTCANSSTTGGIVNPERCPRIRHTTCRLPASHTFIPTSDGRRPRQTLVAINSLNLCVILISSHQGTQAVTLVVSNVSFLHPNHGHRYTIIHIVIVKVSKLVKEWHIATGNSCLCSGTRNKHRYVQISTACAQYGHYSIMYNTLAFDNWAALLRYVQLSHNTAFSPPLEETRSYRCLSTVAAPRLTACQYHS